jgi:hypothetical protein
MDGTALASVISSGSVAALTLVINAMTKRGDRKYATNLEFQKRVWDIKSTALFEVIRKCEAIRVTIPESLEPDDELRAANAFCMFDAEGFSLTTPELFAYASRSVNEVVERLDRLMRASQVDAALLLLPLRRELKAARDEAEDQGDNDKAASIIAKQMETLKQLGRESGIRVGAVNSLCERIIDHARNDLRAKETS